MVEPPHQGAEKNQGKKLLPNKGVFKSITSNKNKEKKTENWKLSKKKQPKSFILLMAEILHHLGCKNLTNNGEATYQLVQDFSHQQYQPQNTAFQGMFWDASHPNPPADWCLGQLLHFVAFICQEPFLFGTSKVNKKTIGILGLSWLSLIFGVVMGLSLIFGLLGVLRSS